MQIKILENVKKFSLILSLIISLSVLLGILSQFDNRWAKAKNVQELSIRLEQKIAQDRANALQERMWKLEDKWGLVEEMPPEIKDEYRQLEREWRQIIENLRELK